MHDVALVNRNMIGADCHVESDHQETVMSYVAASCQVRSVVFVLKCEFSNGQDITKMSISYKHANASQRL